MEYWLIYTLKLEDDCWYVGRTTQKAFKERMKDHWNGKGKGSIFTTEHRPIRIYDIEVVFRSYTSSEAEAYENKQTLKMAGIWGKEHVRGGGYSQRQPNWPTDLI